MAAVPSYSSRSRKTSSMMPSMAGQVLPRAALPRISNAFEPLDLAFGLHAVLQEGGADLFVLGPLRHLGQRLEDLLFRVVDVLAAVEKQSCQALLAGAGFLRLGGGCHLTVSGAGEFRRFGTLPQTREGQLCSARWPAKTALRSERARQVENGANGCADVVMAAPAVVCMVPASLRERLRTREAGPAADGEQGCQQTGLGG